MPADIAVQFATDDTDLPGKKSLITWAESALFNRKDDAEMTIRIVDEEESQSLNTQWRNIEKPTNVLSFPAGEINEHISTLLGDLVICAPVVKREAKEQKKSSEAHWAQMVIHGTLHLLGYDHINEKDANEMESLETSILKTLDFPDPYTIDKR